MSQKKHNNFTTNAPGLFSPSIVRSSPESGVVNDRDVGVDKYQNYSDLERLSEENARLTTSTATKAYGSGLDSTQELKIDYSRFENFTFFDSAVSKVNVAFDRIINFYPFDGTRLEKVEFNESLTGFEKHVFDNMQKSVGYLNLSGTLVGEHLPPFPAGSGQYITVKDRAGYLFPDNSSQNDSSLILSPRSDEFTVEFFLNIPNSGPAGPQTIFQIKKSNTEHISIALSGSIATATDATCPIVFAVSSGSVAATVRSTVQKGTFQHVAAVYDTEIEKLKLCIDATTFVTSSTTVFFEDLNFEGSDLLIGSGSIFSTTGSLDITDPSFFEPTQTLSASIDELRYFHTARHIDDIVDNRHRNIDAQPYLKLYYRFNEPSGSYQGNDVVLDYSGNSLHSKITNFNLSANTRSTSSLGDPPLKYEKLENNPVLFSDIASTKKLNKNLLLSGAIYDEVNPNLITNLLPKHYFLESQNYFGLENITGSLGNALTPGQIPGAMKIGTGETLTAFLLIWAKYFDELKLYIDTLSNVLNVNYDSSFETPDKFISMVGKYYGFQLPGIYSKVSTRQYFEKIGINSLGTISKKSLYEVQNDIWKRILINLKYMQKSKGTIRSIKSLIRNFGIDPDFYFDIKEFGGQKKSFLVGNRKEVKKIYNFLNFSGSLAERTATDIATINDRDGFSSGTSHVPSPFITSPFLSASRTEIGYPQIRGTFINAGTQLHGFSNNKDDGILTSGSWTYEGMYKWPTNLTHHTTQSLARMFVTGSSLGTPSGWGKGLLFNIVAIKDVDNPRLELYYKDDGDSALQHTHIKINSASLFNGSPWYVSLTYYRDDDNVTKFKNLDTTSKLLGHVSSSIILRCGDTSLGNYYSASAYIDNPPSNNTRNPLKMINSSFNAYGPFIAIGSQSIPPVTARARSFLRNPSVTQDARASQFSGQINFIRFWSKATSEKEAVSRLKSIGSLGVDDPTYQYNHDTSLTGSFNRLRIDAKIGTQHVTASDTSGNLRVYDSSQNNFHFSGGGFEPVKNVMIKDPIKTTVLSPKFDERQNEQKVRIHSFQTIDNLRTSDIAQLAPINDISEDRQAEADNRFSIDMSIVKALDEDIMKMFSSLEFFDDALGDPRDMFEADYQSLENMRKIYFKDLVDKLNLSAYSEFFTWFDDAFSNLISQFVPIQTNFFGVNYVIESHVLERSRTGYNFEQMYVLDRIDSDNTELGN